MDNRILRLIDANLNRCREGLRVIEDTARFLINDTALFLSVRKIRHSVDIIARQQYSELVKSRNSIEDRGRTVPEKGRKNISGLIAANFKRAEEAVRVLEEYGKLLSPKAGAHFKKIRFSLYAVEKKYDAVKQKLKKK